MVYPSQRIKITKDLSFLIKDGLNKIQSHRGFLALLWAVFYLPTSLFSYFRLDPYLNQSDVLSSVRWDVFLMIILLNLLGYVPMIAIALLIREDQGGEYNGEYNGIVLDAFRRIPFFITTTFAVALRLILPVFVFFFPGAFLVVLLTSAGLNDTLILGFLIPYFILIIVFFLMRYYSATMFYLMKDVSNFKAVRSSTNLFRSNKKLMIPMLGGCILLPALVSTGIAFLIKNHLLFMIVSLLVGAFAYIGNGVFANLFLYLKEEVPGSD